MLVVTDTNVHTTQATMLDSFPTVLRVAFAGGSVIGFTVVGLGLFDISIFYFLMTIGQDGEETSSQSSLLAAKQNLSAVKDFFPKSQFLAVRRSPNIRHSGQPP